ncbi:MAG: TIGR02611 family protein [Lapillicoccus sp.]
MTRDRAAADAVATDAATEAAATRAGAAQAEAGQARAAQAAQAEAAQARAAQARATQAATADAAERRRSERADDNLLLDAGDDDWAWRRRIRANPVTARIYRTSVGVVGLLVVVGGLVAVPAPGPGWLIVFAGVSIWATEFEWAQRLLRWGRGVLAQWTGWMGRQAWWVKGAVGLATAVLVLAIFWALLALTGIPALLPDAVEVLLRHVPGLD